MKVLVIVPSKQRPELFKKHTFSWLQHCEVDYIVMLEETDVSAYTDIGVPWEKVLVLEEKNKGLGYSLRAGMLHAKNKGYDAIFKIDDDVRKFRKRLQNDPFYPAEKITQRVENFKQVLNISEQILDKQPRVGAIGFVYDNQMFEKKDYTVNKKLQTCYIIRTKLYNPIPEISSQEDYYAYLNVRAAGYKSVRLQNYGIRLGIEVGKGEGGLQSKDLANRLESAKKEVELLKTMFPGIVIKYKPNTAWGYEIDFSKSKLEK